MDREELKKIKEIAIKNGDMRIVEEMEKRLKRTKTVRKFEIPSFETQEETFAFIHQNKDIIKAARKATTKQADAFAYVTIQNKQQSNKADIPNDANAITVRCIINTTNLFDSHNDMHIAGIWKKTLSEKKAMYLCQEHSLSFKGIITDELKAYTKEYTWQELGYAFDGTTEALVFDAIITKERNPFMFDQYKNGYVKNHSVGMQYVKEFYCLNTDNPDYAEYKQNWDKYIDLCANKSDAIARGFMYVVTEAKIIEGSAVVKGSCWTTPTLSISENKQEPLQNTPANKKKVFIN